jgi:hypothetical protein
MSLFDDSRLDWGALDPLVFSGRKVEFIRRVSEATDCGLNEAQEILARRYEFLRSSKPEGFSQSDEEYWEGFYS